MLNFFRSGHKQKQQVLDTWQPVFDSARHQLVKPPGPLSRQAVRLLIQQWLDNYEHAQTEEKIGLAVLAYRLDIHRYALGMLIEDEDNCLIGIRILGYLGEEAAWPTLRAIALGDDPELAHAARRALEQINQGRARAEFQA